ncbi:MAG: ScyD/ScyE family protein [Ginsengibacter sp.]
MKILLQQRARLKTGLLKLTCIMLLFFFAGCRKGAENPTVKVSTIATGLATPMGIETDRMGNIWIAETGTAHNDGKVIIVKPNGTKYDAIVNLSSIANEQSGETEGPAHLLLDNGTMYILAGDYMYKANVSSFRPGDKAIDASTLAFEDIGKFVRTLNIVVPNDSHPYNLAKGPDGDIYITDAGANAIIHRKSAGNYSILAKLPDFDNPTPVGPPHIQRVPTGIIFDGHDFLVTTLTGFPFLEGKAVIYKVSLWGNVSIYQSGFTTLVSIEDGNIYGHVVLHFGSFGATGFNPNTGSFMLANGSSTTVLLGGLNMPVGLKQINNHSWYITSMGDGTLLKVTYD